MVSLNNVNSGDAANSSTIQQVIDVLKGTAGAGNVPISLTAISDSANFALTVRNLDGTNGRSFRVQDSSGNSRLQVDLAGTAAADPTGAGLAPIVTTNATQTLSAKTLNNSSFSQLAASSNALQVPQVRTFNASSQTIANNTVVPLTFPTKMWDNDTLHSTTTNPTRINFSRSGLWHIGGCASMDANSSGFVSLAIRITGAANNVAQATVPNTNLTALLLNVGVDYQCASSDYAELTIQHTSGGNLGTSVSGAIFPSFWAHYVGTT